MLKKILAWVFACAIGHACADRSPYADTGPSIVTSILPLYHIAEAVVGNQGTVTLLVPQGASEHAFALKPSQYEAIKQADLVIWIGPVLETYLMDALSRVPDKKQMVLMNDPSMIRHHFRTDNPADQATIDPHLWLDPLNAITLATQLEKRLIVLDPDHEKQYRKQADAFVGKISALNASLDKQLAPAKGVPFVSYHDAYQYFEKRYGLRRVESISNNPNVPLSATRWLEMSLLLKSEHVHCIVSEPQHQTDLLTKLAQDHQARVASMDPLGTLMPAGTDGYVRLLTAIGDGFASCLQK